MKRRSFLGLFGCGVVGFALDWSGAPVDLAPLPGYGRMYDWTVHWPDTVPDGVGVVTLVRPDALAHGPILAASTHSRGIFRWVAQPAGEIVFREGRGLDVQVERLGTLPHTVAPDWTMCWQANGVATVTGCLYCGTAYFDWPSGGKCRRCGGRLPAPLRNLSGRFCTQRCGEQHTTLAFEPWVATPDQPCGYCGVQLVDGRCIAGCGGHDEQNA